MSIKDSIISDVNPTESLKKFFKKSIEGLSPETINKINEEAKQKGYEDAYDEFCKCGGNINSQTYLNSKKRVALKSKFIENIQKGEEGIVGYLHEMNEEAKKEGYKNYFEKFCAEYDGEFSEKENN